MTARPGVPRRLLETGAAAAAGVGLWWWWRLHPTSRPFAQRLWVDFPHPFVTRERLRRALAPRPGQRVVSVGVGSGRYVMPVVNAVGDSGLVVAVDLHTDMLELARRRTSHESGRGILPVAADAQALPFPDATFDAAWMVSSLGQVPDPVLALAEARRVVRPGGRVVVGELAYDPHGVFFGRLRRYAAAAGLQVSARFGGRPGYVATLTGAERLVDRRRMAP